MAFRLDPGYELGETAAFFVNFRSSEDGALTTPGGVLVTVLSPSGRQWAIDDSGTIVTSSPTTPSMSVEMPTTVAPPASILAAMDVTAVEAAALTGIIRFLLTNDEYGEWNVRVESTDAGAAGVELFRFDVAASRFA